MEYIKSIFHMTLGVVLLVCAFNLFAYDDAPLERPNAPKTWRCIGACGKSLMSDEEKERHDVVILAVPMFFWGVFLTLSGIGEILVHFQNKPPPIKYDKSLDNNISNFSGPKSTSSKVEKKTLHSDPYVFISLIMFLILGLVLVFILIKPGKYEFIDHIVKVSSELAHNVVSLRIRF